MPKIDECILGALSGNGFFITFSFLAAKPVSGLALHGTALPKGWEAAVPSHGGYFEWYLIGNHPVLFVAGVLLLLVPAAALYKGSKRKELLGEVVETTPIAHAVARALGIAAFILSGCWWAFHVAATVYPA